MARHAKLHPEPPACLALAHDLNNELGIIIAECDLLEDSLKQDAAAYRRLKLIRMTARRMADKLSATSWPGPPAESGTS